MRAITPVLAAAWLVLATVASALAPIPEQTGYVTDQTGVIEPEVQAQIQMRLAKYEIATGRKLAALLVQATPGEALEAYADRVLAAWKLDQVAAGGALLLWTAEGYVLIRSVGPVLQRLDGAAQSEILSRWVVPAFAQGQAGEGIRAGVERMMAVLDGEPVGYPSEDATIAATPADTTPITPDGPLSSEAEGMPESAPGSVTVEVAVAGVPWLTEVDAALRDVERLVQGVVQDPWPGIQAWLREAGGQFRQLDVLGSAVWLQLRGETVEPPFPAVQLYAFLLWIAAAVLAVVLAVRGSVAAGLVVLGFGGGMALWVATAYTALAGVLLGLGLLAPILAPLLRLLFRGADDSERAPELPSAVPRPASVRPQRQAARPPMHPSTSVRPAPAVRTTASGSGKVLSPQLQTLEPALRELAQELKFELGRLRWLHWIALLAAFAVAPPLVILFLLGVLGWRMYRSGLAYLLAGMVQDPQLRVRLQARLPRPPNAPGG